MKKRKIIIKPTRKEISEALMDSDEAKLYSIGKSFVVETNAVIDELARFGISNQKINNLKDDSIDEQIENAEYLNMSVDEIYEWYSYLSDRYIEALKINGIVKRANTMKEHYYPIISDYISDIYIGLEVLLSDEKNRYLEYVNRIKSEVPDNYADLVPYGTVSDLEMDNYINGLNEYRIEVWSNVNNLQISRTFDENKETGRRTMGIFGIDNIKDLDDAIRKEHEENDNKKQETVQSLVSAMSVLRGNNTTSIGAFDAVRNKKNDDGSNGN